MKRGLMALGAISLLALTFQNCSLVKPAGVATSSSLLANSACQPILMEEFLRGYYPFVRDSRSCVGCHYEGGLGSGAFAAVNTDIAFDAFMTKGEDKVAQFATSAHKAPNTGQDFPQSNSAGSEIFVGDCQGSL